ncbi:MAG: carboxypeptidase regulatory-like domain-containing protein [Pirellulaceae bacterium]
MKWLVSLALAIVVLAVPSAFAQSSIAGQVQDSSGAVLPGVTVEAASPALIEQVRTAATDGAGQYRLVDLRPGVYTVTFTLPGFTTVRREAISLAADVTVTVDAEMRIGALEETIVVTGGAPLVDVRSPQRTEVLLRETLESIPTARTNQGIGVIIPGVKTGRADVGGSQAMENTTVSVHGSRANETSMLLDGMNAKPLNDIGGTQVYHNTWMFQEMSFQTSAVGAETAQGGVRLNVILRDGGNQFNGDVYWGGTRGSWQSENITPELRARGLPSVDAVQHIIDFAPSFGGPLVPNKLWFFGGYRYNSVNEIVAGNFYEDGSPGIEDQYVQNASLRMTWQASQRNKLSAYFDRQWKFKGHDMGTPPLSAGIEPGKASTRRDPNVYYVGLAKWTFTASNRLLVETGYSAIALNRTTWYQPGVLKERGTPEWYANASREDFIRQTRTTAAENASFSREERHVISSIASYVTGSHAFKAGFQWNFGVETDQNESNADLTQLYRNGVPESVRVRTTPVNAEERLKADLGIFVQDSWTIRQLTVNPGVRFEYFRTDIEPTGTPAGRFAPARQVARMTKLPEWFDVAPRLSAVYDLFGNGRTAIKASANKYMNHWATGFARRYNPMILDSDVRDWFDVDLIPATSRPSGQVLPTNGDDIAQDNEIGPSNNTNFGRSASRTPDPDIERTYSWEYSVGVQQQLTSFLSLTAAWYHRTYRSLEKTDNILVNPSDYVAFQVPNPLDSSDIITVYNLSPAKRGQVQLLDTNSDTNRQTYDGFELSFATRLPNGGNIFGGWTADRHVSVSCDAENPNGEAGTDIPTGLSFHQGGRFCDQRALGLPFRSDFKIAGAYPIPFGIQASMSLQSYAGQPLQVSWVVPANLFPAGRTKSETVPLVAPGEKYLPRWTQMDIGVKRTFVFGNRQIIPQAEIFNLLNSSVVLSENQTFGASLGQPTSTLLGRLLRLAVQVKF